jgi:hypothetical protein
MLPIAAAGYDPRLVFRAGNRHDLVMRDTRLYTRAATGLAAATWTPTFRSASPASGGRTRFFTALLVYDNLNDSQRNWPLTTLFSEDPIFVCAYPHSSLSAS